MFNFEKLEVCQKAIATGSVFEAVSQLFIAARQNVLAEDQRRHLYQAAEEQSRMLSGLRRSLGVG